MPLGLVIFAEKLSAPYQPHTLTMPRLRSDGESKFSIEKIILGSSPTTMFLESQYFPVALMKCRCCDRREAVSNEDLCGPCQGTVEIIRQNLAAAEASKRRPPKKRPNCKKCGDRMGAVLFRPDGKWFSIAPRGLSLVRGVQEVLRSL
jgi:hypothetical protein